MSVAPSETARQYRVARQTVEIHGFLRDRFLFLTKVSEIFFLFWSIVLCATTFAGDDLYSTLGLTPEKARIFLGVGSVGALVCSVALLVMGWRERWAEHKAATLRWATVLERFRALRDENGSWSAQAGSDLNSAYWEVAHNSIQIPSRSFNRLKARYLRKAAISELTGRCPGCPRLLLWLALVFTHILAAFRGVKPCGSWED
jgi:hypothetical protein